MPKIDFCIVYCILLNMEDSFAIIETYGYLIEYFIYSIVWIYIILIACSYIFIFFLPVRFNTYIYTYLNKN